MRSRIGRPRLPKGESKDVQIGVRFNGEQDRPIDSAAVKAGQTKAEWVRNAAVEQAKKPCVWFKSKWTQEELDGKDIEFRLTKPNVQVTGVGELLVRMNHRQQ